MIFFTAGMVNGIAGEPSPSLIAIGMGDSIMRRVVFLAQRSIADDSPAWRFHRLDFQPVLGINAHGCGQHQRRSASDGVEPHFQIRVFEFRRGRERFHGGVGGGL